MGRIVTPKPKAGIRTFKEGQPPPQQDDRMTRIIKYIPSEVIAGYAALKQLIPTLTENLQKGFFIGNLVLFFILNIVYLKKYAKPGDPVGTHIAVSSVAYFIWIYCTDGKESMVTGAIYQAGIAGILLLLFTIATGFIEPKAES